MYFRYQALKIINWVVLKVPFFFSERMVFIAKDFSRTITPEEEKIQEKYEVIKTYSLLDPRLKWKLKAVSSVCPLSAEQVNRVHQWKKRTDLHRFRPISKASINDNGWINIGYFTTNENGGNFLNTPIGNSSEYVKGCDVRLISFSNGIYYLSMYWHLSDKATLLVKDVDVSQFKNIENIYFTCNPFNSSYGSSTYIGKAERGNETILNGLNTINKEIDSLEQYIKKMMRIKASSILTRNLDVLVEENEPYFLDKDTFKKNLAETDQCKSDTRYRIDEVVLNRFPQPAVFITYENLKEHEFLINRISNFQNMPFSQVFIKSEYLTQEEVSGMGYATYANLSLHIMDSHNAFAVYQLFIKQLNQIDDKYADFILNNHEESERQYDVMYKAYLETHELERQIANTISGISRLGVSNNEHNYMKTLIQKCKNALERVREVKNDMENKKTNANELVQAENLKYQKKNSQLVLLLAFVQIVLAYLAIGDTSINKLLSPINTSLLLVILFFFLVFHPFSALIKVVKKLLQKYQNF